MFGVHGRARERPYYKEVHHSVCVVGSNNNKAGTLACRYRTPLHIIFSLFVPVPKPSLQRYLQSSHLIYYTPWPLHDLQRQELD